jgi:vacuolar-type H+-ATPase subunit B/Vma2
MQTQRLIGQQSLGDFMGLHVNLKKIFEDNFKKTGVTRKNNFIINTNNNPTRDERKQRIE